MIFKRNLWIFRRLGFNNSGIYVLLLFVSCYKILWDAKEIGDRCLGVFIALEVEIYLFRICDLCLFLCCLKCQEQQWGYNLKRSSSMNHWSSNTSSKRLCPEGTTWQRMNILIQIFKMFSTCLINPQFSHYEWDLIDDLLSVKVFL